MSEKQTMDLPPGLRATLVMVAEAAALAAGDWWIIGSAAVALHGHRVSDIKDVDLLMAAADAEAFLKRVGERARKGVPDDRFQSAVFGTWTTAPVPVEVMGGLQVRSRAGWQQVAPATRERVTIQGKDLFVPSRDELVRLLHMFGRKKDLARAGLMAG